MHAIVTSPKRPAIVARVSTEDQEQYGSSLDEQEAKCRLLAQLKDYTVDAQHVYRGDESGLLPLDERPIIQHVLADARAGAFGAIAFYKLDRMARRLKYM